MHKKLLIPSVLIIIAIILLSCYKNVLKPQEILSLFTASVAFSISIYNLLTSINSDTITSIEHEFNEISKRIEKIELNGKTGSKAVKDYLYNYFNPLNYNENNKPDENILKVMENLYTICKLCDKLYFDKQIIYSKRCKNTIDDLEIVKIYENGLIPIDENNKLISLFKQLYNYK
jgi:hypothetical protein